MLKIIPLISLIGIFAYILHLPAPMDKINKAVEKREFYHLRLMDEARKSFKTPTLKKEGEKEAEEESKNFVAHRIPSIHTVDRISQESSTMQSNRK